MVQPDPYNARTVVGGSLQSTLGLAKRIALPKALGIPKFSPMPGPGNSPKPIVTEMLSPITLADHSHGDGATGGYVGLDEAAATCRETMPIAYIDAEENKA